jgi:hypothetical protein
LAVSVIQTGEIFSYILNKEEKYRLSRKYRSMSIRAENLKNAKRKGGNIQKEKRKKEVRKKKLTEKG